MRRRHVKAKAILEGQYMILPLSQQATYENYLEQYRVHGREGVLK